MKRMTALIALLIVFAPGAATAGTDGTREALAELMIYGLVYCGLILAAPLIIHSFVRGRNRRAVLALPALLTLLLLIIWIDDIFRGHLGRHFLFAIPAILAFYLLAFALHSRWRVPAASGAVIIPVLLFVSNPSAVNYDDFKFVDNNPLENANEKIQLVGGINLTKYVELTDGRIFKSDADLRPYDLKMPVEFTEAAPGDYRIGFTAKNQMTRLEKIRYARHKKAIFKLKRNEVVINNYKKDIIDDWVFLDW